MSVGPVSGNRAPLYTPTKSSPAGYRSAPSTAQADAGQLLEMGHRGPAVSRLQDQLNNAGAYPPLEVDGKFGPNTDAAVRSFQQRNKLEADGLVGSRTNGAIQSGATFEPQSVTQARSDARTRVGEANPEARPPQSQPSANHPVNVTPGLQNQPDPTTNQGRMQQLLAENPQIRSNQDFINHCFTRGNNGWAGASEVAARHGQDLNQLVQNRSGLIQPGNQAVDQTRHATNDDPASVAPATPAQINPDATGAQLETFPVAGGRYNIGYDSNWNNFDAGTARHNSDYSLRQTNASHPNGHLGVDVFGPRGQPIVSPVSGVVERVNRSGTGAGGNTVTVRRGNHRFYMAHLDSIDPNLRPGQPISAGDAIGGLGNSGARSTAPHLHFSIYEGAGGYSRGTINPFPHLTAAQ